MQRREVLKWLTRLGLISFLPNLVLAKDLKKILIVYYSRTLNTHILAQFIQKILTCDMLRLDTLEPYPKDYDLMVARAEFERKKNFKPILQEFKIDLNS